MSLLPTNQLRFSGDTCQSCKHATEVQVGFVATALVPCASQSSKTKVLAYQFVDVREFLWVVLFVDV